MDRKASRLDALRKRPLLLAAVSCSLVFGLMLAAFNYLGACTNRQVGSARPDAFVEHGYYGIDTGLGVCAEPELAKELEVSPTEALPLSLLEFQPGQYLSTIHFKGTSQMTRGVHVVFIRSTRLLRPCAPEDREQCALTYGKEINSLKRVASVTRGERVHVNIPYRFDNRELTVATSRNGEAVLVDAPLGPCPPASHGPTPYEPAAWSYGPAA